MKYTVSYDKQKSKYISAPRLSLIKKNGFFGKGELKKAYNLTLDNGVLKTRKRRALVRSFSSVDGLFGDDTLAYVENGKLYYGGLEITGVHLTLGKKDIHKLGNYLIIYPDGVYVNTANTSEYGYLATTYASPSCAVFTVDESLSEISYSAVESEPETATEGELCAVRDGDGEYVVKRYDGTSWVKIKTYIRIQASGIGLPFFVGEYLVASGFKKLGLDVFKIHEKTDITVYAEGVAFITNGEKIRNIELKRYMPTFDFVTVSGDRLVGVRRGADESGNYVCKMYASATGTPFGFLPQAGGCELSLNICGAFTGLCDYVGQPVAFTESEIIEGRYKNGALIASLIKGYGVDSGAHNSVVCANGRLYYKSKDGICRYDGSYPESISEDLGVLALTDCGAPAAFFKGKYYIKLTNSDSQNTIYVYDIDKKLWCTQDDPGICFFACRGGDLYAASVGANGGKLILFDAEGMSEDEKSYLEDDDGYKYEDDISWSLESSDVGYESFEGLYPIRLMLRAHKASGSSISAGVCYDRAHTPEKEISSDAGLGGAVSIPIPMRRCDTFTVRVQGKGDCEILGYAAQVHEGGLVNRWK